jgi:hypothetical protein
MIHQAGDQARQLILGLGTGMKEEDADQVITGQPLDFSLQAQYHSQDGHYDLDIGQVSMLEEPFRANATAAQADVDNLAGIF